MNSESANSVLACLRSLLALRAWRARLTCSRAWRAWRARVLYEVDLLTRLACIIK